MGRGELGAVLPVYLIAVVFRRIVAGSDIDAGDAAQFTDRKGKLRRGAQGFKLVGLDPVGRQGHGCLHGKLRGHSPGIKGNGNALFLSALFFYIIGKALGRPADCINIHTVDARADDAAQARGTELQIHIEPLFDLIFIVCDGPQLIFRILVEIRVRKPLFIDLHVIFHVLFHSLNLSFCPQNQSCLMVPLYFIYLKKESIK